MIAAGAIFEKFEAIGRGKVKSERVTNRCYIHIAQRDAFDPEHDTITLEFRPGGRVRHLKLADAEKMLQGWRVAQ